MRFFLYPALSTGVGFRKIVTVLLLVTIGHTTTLQPYPVPFDSEYIGYDGRWSPAVIRIGTPQQYLQVLPSTTSSETWMIGSDACDAATSCSVSRGGAFALKASSSWNPLGEYELSSDSVDQISGYGSYGLDSAAFSDAVVVSNQVLTVINQQEPWIGQMGLLVGNIRFENNTDFLPLLSSLVQKASQIPSHSYGYTAGAAYQGTGVPGSLTLGGTDRNRYVANNSSFELAAGYVPKVALRTIQTSTSQTLISPDQPIEVTVDSSTPFLWLPEAVCDRFAQALDLVYDNTLELYLYKNSSTASELSASSLSFDFVISANTSSFESISLNISFDAFNQQLSYPFPGLFSNFSETSVAYFPLRIANNSEQYAIGRAFLQETYLTVDYERNVFSLSQASFPGSPQDRQLVTISRPQNSPFPGPAQNASTGLSTEVKIGVVLAIIVVIATLALSLWLFLRRQSSNAAEIGGTERKGIFGLFVGISSPSIKKKLNDEPAELLADKLQPGEMDNENSITRHELPMSSPLEMPAAEVSPAFFAAKQGRAVVQLNDPRTPIELHQPPQRSSLAKIPHPYLRIRSGPPAPPYSITDSNNHSPRLHGSDVVSPIASYGNTPVSRDGPLSPDSDDTLHLLRPSRSTRTPNQLNEIIMLRTLSVHSSTTNDYGMSKPGSAHSNAPPHRFSWENTR